MPAVLLAADPAPTPSEAVEPPLGRVAPPQPMTPANNSGGAKERTVITRWIAASAPSPSQRKRVEAICHNVPRATGAVEDEFVPPPLSAALRPRAHSGARSLSPDRGERRGWAAQPSSLPSCPSKPLCRRRPRRSRPASGSHSGRLPSGLPRLRRESRPRDEPPVACPSTSSGDLPDVPDRVRPRHADAILEPGAGVGTRPVRLLPVKNPRLRRLGRRGSLLAILSVQACSGEPIGRRTRSARGHRLPRSCFPRSRRARRRCSCSAVLKQLHKTFCPTQRPARRPRLRFRAAQPAVRVAPPFSRPARLRARVPRPVAPVARFPPA